MSDLLKIKRFYYETIGRHINYVYNSVKNLIRWAPIIWKDRDWDGWYIYTILETKIKHQAEYIRSKNRYVEANRDVERMMLCVKLIQKVKDSEYEGEYMDYHDSEYHWLDVPDRPDSKRLEIEQRSEWFDEYFLKHPLEYKRILANKELQIFDITSGDSTSGEVKQRIAMNISHNRQKRAKKILFKLLERNIDRWWD